MPSQLTGLFKTLTWNDYPVRQEAPPKPGQTVVAALTDATHTLTAHHAVVPGTKKLKLADSVVCSISLDQTTSFKKSWVMTTLSQTEQDALLSHEQGHYDLHALLARDFFLRIMELKLKIYTSGVDLTTDISTAQKATVDKSKAVQKKYDDETKTGADKTEQAKWKGFISNAFTMPATPPQSTIDGIPIKIPILTVLSGKGFNF
jgi:hypothetical protein